MFSRKSKKSGKYVRSDAHKVGKYDHCNTHIFQK